MRDFRIWLAALVLAALGGCQTSQQQAGAPSDRYLVYFEEFSADISPEGKRIIADAAQHAKQGGVRAVFVEARASATGSADANKKLAETRAAVVRDGLQANGVGAAMIRQVPIGQTGSGDTGVTERRVDIVLER